MAAIPNLQLGAKVRNARELHGLARETLAADVGLSSSTILRLEIYGQVPNAAALAAIAKRLGLSLDDLLGVGQAVAP